MKQLTVPLLASIAKILSGASVRWVDCEPDLCQRVYFANHTSHLDALVLWASLPKPIRLLTRPVAAADYWRAGPVRRYMASVFNALLIDRKKIKVHNSPIDMMIREIGNQYSLIVFPEGGRNPTGVTGDFKSGLYHLAKKRPDLELMPVHIDNLEPRHAEGRISTGAFIKLYLDRSADLFGIWREQERVSFSSSRISPESSS